MTEEDKDTSETKEFNHISVLLEETILGLRIKPNGIYVDGTIGGGGHSYEIVKRLGTNGRLIGIDQDEAAIKAASEKLEEYKDKVTIVRNNYSNIREILKDLNVDKVDGILLDLGVSSHQLDTAGRGFSYNVDAPLDMRMDNRMGYTARDIINDYSESELFRVIRDYGEDGFAKNIAKHIVQAREDKSIETTLELVEVIKGAIPMKVRKRTGHPAKKTFQGIRIELNKELDVLKNSLDDMIDCLNKEGRLCVISFHSLEDRIVKVNFKNNQDPCTCPPEFPICNCGNESKGKIITRKPIIPTEEEIEENRRSKSSKLRIFEKY